MTLAEIVADLELAVKARKEDERVRFPYGGAFYDPADRTQRIAVIGRITEDYKPAGIDPKLLERLADVILDEELTDPNPHKVAQTEYPFFSEFQLARRTEGKHSAKWSGNMRGESPFEHADSYGTDGRNYRVPERRIRSRDEHIYVDETARIRNEARAAQYKRDTSPGRVVTYNLRDTGGEFLPEFVRA